MMEPACSTKIVSLHLDECSNINCVNRDVCYHVKKDIQDKYNWPSLLYLKDHCLKAGYIVHDSICNIFEFRRLHVYKNYNITIPYFLYITYASRLQDYKNQVQVSVFNLNQLQEVDCQKLFLIKNEQSLKYVLDNELITRDDVQCTHFCIDQNFITADVLKELFLLKIKANNTNTIDSCATSWLVNGKCPYSSGNYIDITYDGSIRTCPFNTYGTCYISYDNTLESIKRVFTIEHKFEKCIYSKIFGGK